MTRHLAGPLAAALVALTAACAAPASRFEDPAGPSRPASQAGSADPTGPTKLADPAGPTSSSSTTSPTLGAPAGGSGCTVNAVADDSASGSTVCVVRDSDLTLLLHLPPGDGWSTPQATGAALGPARGVPTPFGFVGWSLPALTPGLADVTTSRRFCPSAAAGGVRCHGVLLYRVHVRVE